MNRTEDSPLTPYLPPAASNAPPPGMSFSASHLWPDYLTGQSGNPVRVILVDDDPSIRRVICQELMADRRTDLVAQGASMRQGLRLLTKHSFDVLMVDLNLGDGSGFELIERMKLTQPAAEAIVLSVLEDEDNALRAFELGATGYLVKNSWFGNFPQAVLQVVNGGASITPNLARKLLHRLRPASPWGAEGLKAKLSDREQDVLRMVASGYTSAEIGSELRISHQTVNAHVKNIYRKLRVHSRAEASTIAAQTGLLDAERPRRM